MCTHTYSCTHSYTHTHTHTHSHTHTLTHTHTHSSDFPCARDANTLGLTVDDCDSVYAYRHRLNLTSDGTLLNDELSNAKLSASPDHPESLLDALLQVAVCEVYTVMRERE